MIGQKKLDQEFWQKHFSFIEQNAKQGQSYSKIAQMLSEKAKKPITERMISYIIRTYLKSYASKRNIWKRNPKMKIRLRELAGRGENANQVAATLSKEFNVEISPLAIAKARSVFASGIERKYNWKSIPGFIDRLKQLIGEGKLTYSEIAQTLSNEFKKEVVESVVTRIANQNQISFKDQRVTSPALSGKKGKVILAIKQKEINLAPEEIKIHSLLRDHRTTLEQLSVLVDKSIPTTRQIIKSLVEKGFDVKSSKDEYFIPRESLAGLNKPHLIKEFYNDRFRFGVIADTQLGSKFQQITHLNRMYDIFVEEGIEHVYHVGDVVDGYDVYRGQEYELFLRGADEQAEYTIKNYPRRELKNGKLMKTHMIAGNHDLSFYKAMGYDILNVVCKEREDLQYMGQWDCTIETKNKVRIYMLHPDGGGAYALSYKAQKFVEGFTSENKPNMFFLGHWHTSLYFFSRNIHCLEAGCFQSQTPYLRRKGLMPQVGGWICEVNIGPDGSVNRFKPEFIPFFIHLKNDF